MKRSGRLPEDLEPTPLSQKLAAATAAIDLTQTNPTQCGLHYPEPRIREALASAHLLPYAPAALGAAAAREAVSRLSRRNVPAEHVVLTASTSEAYALLFKLLCDPGDTVAVPAPSYPLFEHLARLEGVRAQAYRLHYEGRWALDFGSLDAAVDAGARAVITVSPNNPTGSCLDREEAAHLRARCRERGIPLVSDEVFGCYGFGAQDLPTPAPGSGASPLTIILDGLSKSAGLPQLKLAWMEVCGPRAEVEQALEGLAWVADAYLSVGAPVQSALPRILEVAPQIRDQIRARIQANRQTLKTSLEDLKEVDLLEASGGWSAVLRVPEGVSDEMWVSRLASEHGVILHPGFFYDFGQDGYLVASLLPDPETFGAGVARLCQGLRAILGEGPESGYVT